MWQSGHKWGGRGGHHYQYKPSNKKGMLGGWQKLSSLWWTLLLWFSIYNICVTFVITTFKTKDKIISNTLNWSGKDSPNLTRQSISLFILERQTKQHNLSLDSLKSIISRWLIIFYQWFKKLFKTINWN